MPASPTAPKAPESLPAHGSRLERLRAAARTAVAGLLLAVAPCAQAEDRLPAFSTPHAKGALVIAGGGGLPPEIHDTFLELAGGERARIVVIPTASARADLPEQRVGMYWEGDTDTADFSLLHTRDRSMADTPSFTAPLRAATGVWISGGAQSRLSDVYGGTLTERELRGVLERGGVVGGTSAGASAMSKLMIARGNPDAEVDAGLGLLPGVVIDQHFASRKRLMRLCGVLERNPQYVGAGVNDGTALVIQGRSVRVMGDSHVQICVPADGDTPPRVRILNAGEHVHHEDPRISSVFTAAR